MHGPLNVKYISVVYPFQNANEILHFLFALHNDAVSNSEGKVAYTWPTCIRSQRAQTHLVFYSILKCHVRVPLMTTELASMRAEGVTTQFVVLPQHLPRGTKENLIKTCQDS
jgi:hypothetical protein